MENIFFYVMSNKLRLSHILESKISHFHHQNLRTRHGTQAKKEHEVEGEGD